MKKRNLVLFGSAAMLSLALAGSIGAVTAFAEDITNSSPNPQEVTVTYTVSETWTVTIPESITIEAGTGTSSGDDTVTIKAGAILGEGKTRLKVTVSTTDGKFELKNGSTTLEYEIRVDDSSSGFSGSAITSGQEIASTDGGNATDVVKYLQAKIKEDAKAKVAGTYTGQLTFTVTQEDA